MEQAFTVHSCNQKHSHPGERLRRTDSWLWPLPCLSALILSLTLCIYIFNTVISRTSTEIRVQMGSMPSQPLELISASENKQHNSGYKGIVHPAHIFLKILQIIIWLNKNPPTSMGNITLNLGNPCRHILSWQLLPKRH